MRNMLTLTAVAIATMGCSAMRAADPPQIPPLSVREPAFLAYCQQLNPDRRCHPGGGRCWEVVNRHGSEVAEYDPDQEWRRRDLRAACEMYERDKADACLLESELIRSGLSVPTEEPLLFKKRGSLYTLSEAHLLCLQQKARP